MHPVARLILRITMVEVFALLGLILLLTFAPRFAESYRTYTPGTMTFAHLGAAAWVVLTSEGMLWLVDRLIQALHRPKPPEPATQTIDYFSSTFASQPEHHYRQQVIEDDGHRPVEPGTCVALVGHFAIASCGMKGVSVRASGTRMSLRTTGPLDATIEYRPPSD